MFKKWLVIVAVAVMLLPPAPRCRLRETWRGYYFACPCQGASYACEDYFFAGKERPRTWVWVR